MGTLATLAAPSDADSTPILYCWPHGFHLAAEVSALRQNANEKGVVGAGVSFQSFQSFSAEGGGRVPKAAGFCEGKMPYMRL